MADALAGLTSAIRSAVSTGSPLRTAASPGVDGFGEALGRLIEGAEQASADANTQVSAMLNKTGEVHDAMIALQRADLALSLTVQVRNKLVQAYQDVMRMSV